MPHNDKLISACQRVLRTHGLAQSREQETKWTGVPQQRQALATLHRTLIEMLPQSSEEERPPDEVVVTDFVSSRTFQGLVELRVNTEMVQLELSEAIKIALDLINAYACAEADAAFLRFFIERMKMPEEQAGKLFVEFCTWRLAQQTPEETDGA